MRLVRLLSLRLVGVLAAAAMAACVAAAALFPAESPWTPSSRLAALLATAAAIAIACLALRGLLAPIQRGIAAARGDADAGDRRRAVEAALRLPGRIALLVLALSGCLDALLLHLGFGRALPPDLAAALAGAVLACGIAAAMGSHAVVALGLAPVLQELGADEPAGGRAVRGNAAVVCCGLLAVACLGIGSIAYARCRAEAERSYLAAAAAALERGAGRLALRGPSAAAELVFVATGAPTAVLGADGRVVASSGEGAAGLAAAARPAGSGAASVSGGWRVWRRAGAYTLVSALSDAPLRQRHGEILGPAPWLGVALLAALALLVWLVVTCATLPIRALERAAGRIASGELTVAPPLLSRDEVGRLAEHVRGAATALAGAIADGRASCVAVEESTVELGDLGARLRDGAGGAREGVQEVRAAAEEMQGAMARVGQGMAGLADHVRSTTAAGSEMSAALQSLQQLAGELQRRMDSAEVDVERLAETGRRAQARLGSLDALVGSAQTTFASVSATLSGLETSAIASQLAAAQAAELADHAGGVVQETVAGIESLRSAVGDAKRRVTVLGRRSDDIALVLDFIGEVAGRTNLLSLNASIIATQAGEHGKAFAVVADQIRELAAQISSSTKSIGDIIRAVRDDVNGTARLIDRGDELASAGVAHARKSLDALDEIRSATSKGHETAAAILEAVQQHGQSTRDVSNLVGSVSEHSRALSEAVQLIGKSVAGVGSVSRGAGALADEVSRALEERSGLGRRQLEILERLDAALAQIRGAVESHGVASRQVREALLQLARFAEQREGAALQLSTVAERLRGRSRALADRVDRFKI